MLLMYKEDQNIIAINGCNFNYDKNDDDSYFFSRYLNVWGWATWKRAALMIDYNIPSWNKKQKLYFLWRTLRKNIFDFDLDWYRYWRNNFDEIAKKRLDTWDYQWQYYQLLEDKKTIVSSQNLVVNIGFGVDATHTSMLTHPCANLRTGQMIIPIKIPIQKNICKEYEEIVVKPIWHLYSSKGTSFYVLNYINTRPFIQFLKNKIKGK